jgi:predicted kinase
MTFIIPIGISGSGKSYIGEKLKQDYNCVIVCPDDIRKEITGDINNQTKNKEVFDIVRMRTIELLSEGKNVFFSATNVGFNNLFNFLNHIKSTALQSLEIMILWMEDSHDIDLCFKRIQEDIKQNMERSKITDISILERQYKNYKNIFEKKDELRKSFPNIKYFTVNTTENGCSVYKVMGW